MHLIKQIIASSLEAESRWQVDRGSLLLLAVGSCSRVRICSPAYARAIPNGQERGEEGKTKLSCSWLYKSAKRYTSESEPELTAQERERAKRKDEILGDSKEGKNEEDKKEAKKTREEE